MSEETFFLTQQDDFSTIGSTAAGAFTDLGTWSTSRVTFSGGESPVLAGMCEIVVAQDLVEPSWA
jgi:hypothetical protein